MNCRCLRCTQEVPKAHVVDDEKLGRAASVALASLLRFATIRELGHRPDNDLLVRSSEDLIALEMALFGKVRKP